MGMSVKGIGEYPGFEIDIRQMVGEGGGRERGGEHELG